MNEVEAPKKDEVRETLLFYFPKAVVHKHAHQEYSLLLPQAPTSKAPAVELFLTVRTNQWKKAVWNLSQNLFPAIEGGFPTEPAQASP